MRASFPHDTTPQACCELSDDHFQELMMRVWKVDPAAQSQPKFSRANLRRKALDVPLHPHAADLVDQVRSLAKSGGFVVASSSALTIALGCLDRAMLLPNGRVACVRLRALDFFLCPDIMTDNIVCRRAVHALLSLLQDKYASAAMDPPVAKAVLDTFVAPACGCDDAIARQGASCCRPLLYEVIHA